MPSRPRHPSVATSRDICGRMLRTAGARGPISGPITLGLLTTWPHSVYGDADSTSPRQPSPARPSDGQGPASPSSPPVHPSVRGEVGGSTRRPACNHAGAPYCRRRVRGPAAGGYGALPGRYREEAGQDLFTNCIRSRKRAGGRGEPPRTGPAGDHGGVIAPSGLPAARHRPGRRPRQDSVGSVTGDDAPAAQFGARQRKPRVVGRPDGAHRVYESSVGVGRCCG